MTSYITKPIPKEKLPTAIQLRRGSQEWLITPGPSGTFGNFSNQVNTAITQANQSQVETVLTQAAKKNKLLQINVLYSLPFEPLPAELVRSTLENEVYDSLLEYQKQGAKVITQTPESK